MERLYKTQTKSQLVAEEKPQPIAVDKISREPVQDETVSEIVHRLHTTHTQSSGGLGHPPKMWKNSVARAPAEEEEIQVGYIIV